MSREQIAQPSEMSRDNVSGLTGKLVHSLWKNPVMLKEIRTRMRGGRAFVVVSLHLIVLAATVAVAYFIFASSQSGGNNLGARRDLGKVIFGLIVWMELVAICFTAPALSSGAIASERERQTFDLLRVTLLTPARLVLGKYFSGLIFIFLLLFSSLPVLSLAFVIGGVLPQEIFIAILTLSVTAISFCAVGMFFSSLFSRILFPTVLSYAFAIFLVFGVPMVFLFLFILLSASVGPTPDISHFWQILLVFLGWLVISLTPVATMVATEAGLLSQQSAFLVYIELMNGSRVYMPSPWISYTIFYLLLSLLLLWLSVYRVSRMEG